MSRYDTRTCSRQIWVVCFDHRRLRHCWENKWNRHNAQCIFLITHWWSRSIVFNVRFAVRLRDFIIPGASVIHGMVIIGASLNILCCALCASMGLSTLCSAGITGGGWRCVCTHVCSKCNKCLPLGVTVVGGAKLESTAGT
jgi:hypothetical protein